MKEKRLEFVLHLSKSITDTPLEATRSKKDEGLGRKGADWYWIGSNSSFVIWESGGG